MQVMQRPANVRAASHITAFDPQSGGRGPSHPTRYGFVPQTCSMTNIAMVSGVRALKMWRASPG